MLKATLKIIAASVLCCWHPFLVAQDFTDNPVYETTIYKIEYKQKSYSIIIIGPLNAANYSREEFLLRKNNSVIDNVNGKKNLQKIQDWILNEYVNRGRIQK